MNQGSNETRISLKLSCGAVIKRPLARWQRDKVNQRAMTQKILGLAR
ncbi:hypothetical protein [Xenorhabdus kozodoii]|uniref:Uncharacterized protein n=1 Tax=Xenorhabdus kozodoii TaxID=351676 RepID=A0A2D0L652_9GAMM|nr:hypothetical protein [Xenorhabdus kozodoii]PHM71164.1 hypothetical protein Xkoz_02871 [Xenorhabdus kozodoii]